MLDAGTGASLFTSEQLCVFRDLATAPQLRRHGLRSGVGASNAGATAED
jgi:hypothetical protein